MKTTITPVDISNVKVTDTLFGKYALLVAEKIIPYQWNALNDQLPDVEKCHCLDNFRIAAGEQEGRHQGAIFQDTDAYKWLEAVAFCIQNGSGEQYRANAEQVIDLISRAQEPDGYLNTYYTIDCPEQKWKNLTEGHELYGAGHLIEAAVAYHNATGDDKLLGVACRLADLIDTVFGVAAGKCNGYPGHPEIELALVKLYRATAEQRYLALANYFVAQRGKRPNYLLEEMKQNGGPLLFPEFAEYDEEYAQTHNVVTEQKTAEGHAVRAMYLYSAMADLANELDDKPLAEACETLYRNTTERRMYITGGVGSSGKLERFSVDYDLPNDSMYCESCASIGLMMFAQRMALLTGQAHYYDTVERVLCNVVLAGIQMTGDRYFYVNPLEVWPQNCKPSTSMSHVRPVRQKWFTCACCPPNIARTLASLGQYIYSQSDTALYVSQLISSRVTTTLQGGRVTLATTASYMQDGKVILEAQSTASGPIDLMVRVPDYMENASFLCNGQPSDHTVRDGYVVFQLPAQGSAHIQITSSVKPRFVAADIHVRADIGRVAIMKGPFVYCLEEQDNGSNLPCVYAYPERPIEQHEPTAGLPGALPSLSCTGERLTSTVAQGCTTLYGMPHFVREQITLRAVPYALWCNRKPGEMQVWVKARL